MVVISFNSSHGDSHRVHLSVSMVEFSTTEPCWNGIVTRLGINLPSLALMSRHFLFSLPV